VHGLELEGFGKNAKREKNLEKVVRSNNEKAGIRFPAFFRLMPYLL